MRFTVCIPARYGSSRLPGKALLKIGDKTLVRRVYERCAETSAANIMVATDDLRIVEEVESFGGRAFLTDENIPTGSDRVAEMLKQLAIPRDTVVVNVQGDEPFVSPSVIEQVARGVAADRKAVHTVCESLDPRVSSDQSVVKVVRDKSDRALYFSRSSIPWMSNFQDGVSLEDVFRKHVGIYGYTVGVLEKFVSTAPSDLELIERLEQLRFLQMGVTIFAPDAVDACGTGVDTEEDYMRACKMWELEQAMI